MMSRSRQRGYTLVEGLIAIAILSAIAAALAPLLRTAIRASIGIAENASAAEEIRVGDDALAQIFGLMIIPGSDGETAVFDGTSDQIEFSFITNVERGPERARLRISSGRLLYLLPPRVGEASSEVVLLDRVQSFRFYGKPTPDSPPIWVDRWNGVAPPQLIELELFDDKRAAKSLTFKIDAASPLYCAFDQVSRQCRR